MDSDAGISARTAEVPHSPIRKMFNIAQNIGGTINLGIGEPDFATPKHIKQAAKEALDEGYTHYTPNAGFLDLREAIAGKLSKDNKIDVDPKSEIAVTVGAMGALFLSMLTILNDGDKVLIADPGWASYIAQVKLAGGKPIPISTKEECEFKIIPDNIEKVVDPKTKAIIVNSPANPTGAVHSKSELEEIATIANDHNLIVVSDEVYEKFVYDNAEHCSIASLDGMRNRTLTINSFSKTYGMTGWRIGYVAGNRRIIEHLTKLQEHVVAHPSAISQRAALAALEGPQDCVKEIVNEYRRRRDLMVKYLNEIEGMKCNKPKGAFYAFPNSSKTGMNSYDLAMMLLEKARVVTVPGIGFGDNGENHLRLSYAVSESKIEEAVRRMKDALAANSRALANWKNAGAKSSRTFF